MSDGQQLEFPEDEMNWPYEQLHGDYYGGVIKEGHMAFVLSKPVDDSLEGIKLIMSQGFDE
ncbi:hypothetical protein SAMN05192532_102489 [Alteribacillus iranensis]|uniref:Uncharacterized protein n=1 Tax=Alteribacillus iranensis TaxID=930128 RepID=A0A1I2BT27_9BACI|nr:hypothetical protein SAMN05192532_102489 [Alteribacillus iranensis]